MNEVITNKQIVRLIYEDFNNRNFLPPKSSWDDYLSDDFVWNDPGKNKMDREGFTNYFAWMVDSFPDIKADIDIIPNKDNSVMVVRYNLTLTFSKDFKGFFSEQSIPAHGKTFSHTGVDIYDVENGKIKTCTTYTNPQLFMNNLYGKEDTDFLKE
ncbi:MAG: ester cyclase [Promethearchaeota archaeon]